MCCRVLLAGWLGLGLFGIPPAASKPRLGAQKGAREDRATRQARELQQKGDAARERGQWAQALQFYQQAHDKKPLPIFQYYMAECHRGMGNAGRAAFAYRQYLKYGGESINRQEVEELAVRMEQLAEAARNAQAPGPRAEVEPKAGSDKGCSSDECR